MNITGFLPSSRIFLPTAVLFCPHLPSQLSSRYGKTWSTAVCPPTDSQNPPTVV